MENERTVIIPHLALRTEPCTNTLVPVLDLTAATVYGTLKPLTRAKRWSQTMLPELYEGLGCMDSEDLILCVGDLLALVTAISYATDKFGFARVMRYERARKRYHVEVYEP